jgi:hypothetical protein
MNKRMLSYTFILLCLVPTLLLAQVETTSSFAGRGKVGTTGLQFLKIGVSARAVGMGEAFTGLANDASAMYYNPAGLNQLSGKEIFFTHTKWPAGINYEYLGASLPIQKVGVFAAQVAVLTTGDMKRTVPYVGWTGEYFSATDWLFGLSYGRMLTDKFSVGGTVKFISEWLEDEQVSVLAADFGTLFDVGVRGIKFGMMITNFGPNAKFIAEEFALPINFKFGAVVDVFKQDLHRIQATFEGSHPNDNLEQVALGMEYTFSQYFALRGGYRQFVKLSDKDETVTVDNQTKIDVEEPLEGFSFGFGVNLPLNSFQTRIDYAYTDLGFMDVGQRFTIAFQF